MTDVADRVGEASSPETKGERTRRRILELAVEHFGARGYRATSVSEIARAAGLTQAASYAYFHSKDALFAAAVDEDASALLHEAWEQATGTPIRQLVPSLTLFLIAGLDAHPLARRVLAGQEPDAVPRLVNLPAVERFGSQVAAELRAAQERGEIRADFDPRVLASGLESIVMGLLFSTVLAQGETNPRYLVGLVEAFDLLLRPPA